MTHESAMKIKEIEARFKDEADTKAREIGRRLDMVNLGVMNYDVHTPRERMEIDSVKPLYEMLRQILMTVE